jgi:hypothetical protein
MTDEDLEQLLRETFADTEKFVTDSLPQATKATRRAPIVLAAAASVLVVLAGVLYGVSRGGEVEPPVTAPAVGATTATATDADIWAPAIVAIAERYRPEQGWKSLVLLDRTAAVIDPTESSYRVRQFSQGEQARISAEVGKVAPVTWTTTPWGDVDCTGSGLAAVSVGPVADKGDHREVPISIAIGCDRGFWLTYRLDDQGGVWKVTGIVGRVGGIMPASCAQSASPRADC